MDKRNIEGFMKENPDKQFPKYRSLSKDESAQIRRDLISKLKLENDISLLDLAKKVRSSSDFLKGNAEDEGFNLINFFKDNNIKFLDNVLINFYQYDDIDEMRLKDVSNYLEYIWYPSSDDIEIFDNTLSSIISITHDGEILLLRLDRE